MYTFEHFNIFEKMVFMSYNQFTTTSSTRYIRHTMTHMILHILKLVLEFRRINLHLLNNYASPQTLGPMEICSTNHITAGHGHLRRTNRQSQMTESSCTYHSRHINFICVNQSRIMPLRISFNKCLHCVCDIILTPSRNENAYSILFG